MTGKGLFLATFLALACEPAQANDTQSDMIGALQSQGYTVEKVSRTFLGRIKLTVSNGTKTREIVVSRHTGEVLHQRTLSNTSKKENGLERKSSSISNNKSSNASGYNNAGGNGKSNGKSNGKN